MNRRTLLFGVGAAMTLRSAPSGQIRVGVIGAGGRGQLLMRLFQADPTVRITAIADVYEPNLEAGIAAAKGTAKAYRNHRQLLDDNEVDVVIVATPEHWHAQMLLDALDAGKDVYVEKPLCHTPEQGVALIDAARGSTNIVQVGMQRRSYELFLRARDIRASGELGEVRLARSWWVNNSLRTQPETKLEGKLDWEQWQGPVPHVPFDADRFRNWRNYTDYSGGIVADQGAHVYDGIHLIRGVGYPAAVSATAGRVHDPKADTPETVVVAAEYPEDFLGVFTLNYAGMHYPTRLDQLNQFDGDRARLDVGREFASVYTADKPEAPSTTLTGSFSQATEAHVRNFLDCVRSRKEPAAPVEKGFQAALVIHMANLSLKLGRRVRWDAAKRKVEA